MNEQTRQAVAKALQQAHEGALKSILLSFDAFTPDDVQALQRGTEELFLCLKRQFESELIGDEAARRIGALIFGHSNPALTQVLRQYAENLAYLLTQSRDEFAPSKGSKDN